MAGLVGVASICNTASRFMCRRLRRVCDPMQCDLLQHSFDIPVLPEDGRARARDLLRRPRRA